MLVAAVLLPNIPRATSRSRLESYAVQIGTLLEADRTAAIRRRDSRRQSPGQYSCPRSHTRQTARRASQKPHVNNR